MDKIVVIGGGTMGAGIAFVAASAGYAVDLIEPDAGARDRAKERIAKDAGRTNSADVPGRLNYYESLQEGARADLAVEAAPERMDLKRSIFQTLARVLGPDTLLATNTSSLSVSEIAEGIEQPERVLGLHFFNPPAAMKLVEIVRGEQTGDAEVARARSIVERLQKVPVVAADTPGFIVNRVARPYYLQAMRAYDAGVAPLDDLDRLARGVGFRMGPFELMDLIGLDVNLATSDSIYAQTGADRLEPVALQRDLVAQNRLGRKAGSGFYDYSSGAPQRDDELPQPSGEVDDVERIVILGYAGLALEMRELLDAAYENVELWDNEDTLDDITLDTTVVFDIGDGVNDRSNVIAELDALLAPETVIFVDAYATDIDAAAKRMRHPHRLVGYGILSSLESQNVVEIVDAEQTSDDALELAQELFESIGRRVALVENHAGLFLGRTVGSIVNEAVIVVQENIASPDDVDLAMRLGTNYPQGPLEWGREIGGDRIVRILQRLAGAEGAAFAPHRALWVLDVHEEEETSTGG
jgi:3-hydroxybutyryl-CoA dehydrogenase